MTTGTHIIPRVCIFWPNHAGGDAGVPALRMNEGEAEGVELAETVEIEGDDILLVGGMPLR